MGNSRLADAVFLGSAGAHQVGETKLSEYISAQALLKTRVLQAATTDFHPHGTLSELVANKLQYHRGNPF